MSNDTGPFICKLILIGDQSVGKTSLLSKFISDKFSDFYHETIGVEFATKSIPISDTKKVKFQFWDANGSEKYRYIMPAYSKGASAVLAVYDITDLASFNSIKAQLEYFKSQINENTVVMVIGNKLDLADEKRQVSFEDLIQFTNQNKYMHAEVSAKLGTKISESFISVAKMAFHLNENNFTTTPRLGNRSISCSFTLPKINQNFDKQENTNSITNLNSENLLSKSEFLNAHSNSFLLANGPVLYKDQNKKIIADLVDQVSILRDEISRKDELIKNLNTIDQSAKVKTLVEEKYDVERPTIDLLRKELSEKALDLSNARESNLIKEARVTELTEKISELNKRVNELEKLNASQYNESDVALIKQDCQRFESIVVSSEFTINRMREEAKELENKLTDCTSEINSLKVDLDGCRDELAVENKQLAEIASFFSVATCGINLVEHIKQSLAELRAETLKSRTSEELTNEKIIKVESDNKVSHEVVDRLTNSLNSSETTILALKQEIESLKIRMTCERDVALKGKSGAVLELEKLKMERVRYQEELKEVKMNLEMARVKFIGLEEELGKVTKELSTEQNLFKLFKEDISRCLSDGQLISTLEEQIDDLQNKLNEQNNQYIQTKTSNDAYRARLDELESSVNSLQMNLTATLAARDQLNTDRLTFTDFFQNLASILKMSYAFDKTNQNNILSRVKELVGVSEDATRVQNKMTTVNYDQKLRSLEEELSNKESHLNVLRSKIVDLEEGNFGRVYGKSELKTEFNEMLMLTKKQKFKIDKISGEYNALKEENTLLKAEAMDNINLDEILKKKGKEICELKDTCRMLHEQSDKQLVKISELQETNELLDLELRNQTRSSDEVVVKLSKDLRDIKQEMLKSEAREKQLLEFRDIVSKKLGLNISGFTLGEYEYIANIENVLNMPQHMGLFVQQANSMSVLGNCEEMTGPVTAGHMHQSVSDGYVNPPAYTNIHTRSYDTHY